MRSWRRTATSCRCATSQRWWSCHDSRCRRFIRSKYASAAGLARGAYLSGHAPNGAPDVVLIATGSEVALALEAHEQLLTEGVRSRVVSMPSWDIFEHQSQGYRDSVLPPKVTARVAIEQASAFGWERYVGQSGRVIGMQTFGASAPLKALMTDTASRLTMSWQRRRTSSPWCCRSTLSRVPYTTLRGGTIGLTRGWPRRSIQGAL